MNTIQAIEYYEIKIEENGAVKDFKAHYLKETPPQMIAFINDKVAGRVMTYDPFEDMKVRLLEQLKEAPKGDNLPKLVF